MPPRVRKHWLEIVFGLLALSACGLAVGLGGRLSEGGQGQPAATPGESYLETETAVSTVLAFTTYTVVSGDTISGLAARFDLNQDSIISCNDIERARQLRPGDILRIPNIDGLMVNLDGRGDPAALEAVAARFDVSVERILATNNALTPSDIKAGRVFVPDARLDVAELREIQGDLFSYPVAGGRGWISSTFGFRRDPFTGARRFHNGIDLPRPTGTAVMAAMDGTVASTGYTESAGNYITVRHQGGYTTFYAHLSRIEVVPGQRVRERQRIGAVGNTGYSTGSHLHFTVFRWGRAVNPLLYLR